MRIAPVYARCAQAANDGKGSEAMKAKGEIVRFLKESFAYGHKAVAASQCARRSVDFQRRVVILTSEPINVHHKPVTMHADFDVRRWPFPVAAGVSPAISSLAFAKP
jgi:hypothetical protein